MRGPGTIAAHEAVCVDPVCRDCWSIDWHRAVGRGDDDRQAELEAEGRDRGWIF